MLLTFIDAGQLTARLDLESAVETPDGQGGVTLSHAVTASLWARIEPVGAEIEELGHTERQTVTHRIWIRHSDLIAPGQRFRKGTRIFDIRTLHDPDESGRYLVCRVTEV
ncbi:phage head closure protein [Rhizobium sp. KVB221]|uniref:Phage head closure protein n=1 Tax=Rhizobium setariae TaxID=2801340 RepID=A0A936YLS3_9HYPH|nr:phage head closure protein [Rhizobium setariae]MBL0371072.1 phage head closure protein [Rhizobium setariae]